MNRTRKAPSAPHVLLALHDAALLLVVFLAPILWGGLSWGGVGSALGTLEAGSAKAGFTGLSVITLLVTVAALAALTWRLLQHSRPLVLPNAVHLPVLLFLAISALATLASVNMYASWLELNRLLIGALFFLLVAHRALLPAADARLTLTLFLLPLPLLFFTNVSGEDALAPGSSFPPLHALLDGCPGLADGRRRRRAVAPTPGRARSRTRVGRSPRPLRRRGGFLVGGEREARRPRCFSTTSPGCR